MQITFNPHDPADLSVIARLLGTATPVVEAAAPAPAPTEPDEPAGTSADPKTTDIHGMVWNADIHSTPPARNADGSWRARRGRKDEYDAAIAAHKARSTADAGEGLAASAPDTMPAFTAPDPEAAHGGGSLATTAPVAEVTVQHSPEFAQAAAALPTMPAPAPTHTPRAPITYEQMGQRFLTKYQQPMGTPGGLPVEYETVYADLGMVNAADPTNQTNIDRCWHYMDALDQGLTHGDAVRYARGLA